MTEIEEHSLPLLPDWLRAVLPEAQEPAVMDLGSDDQLTLRDPDGRVDTFGSLPEAYEASRASEWDLQITDAVLERFGDGHPLRHLTYPSETGDGHLTVVFSRTDADRLRQLRRAFRDFLDIATAYETDPKDFYQAWRFVDHHPAFWTAPDLDQNPWHWDVSGYVSRLTQFVWKQDDELGRGGVGPAIVSLEAGAHVPADEQRGTKYRDHYLDWRLSVDAPSYEHAIVRLAELVALCFELDGSDKPVDAAALDKPPWVMQLESRLDSIPNRNTKVPDPAGTGAD